MNLEPTYLRYIYDGLIKDSVHPENAAELPDGLIGMYEEAFDERTSVIERQKLLQRFAIWALLKKEVSAAFVAEVLAETEDDIQEFISTYSAWFNSPESGKYQLYHERLKVYLLQKMSEGEVHTLHEKLITRLERAIEEQKADEFEWYGLEFLSNHLRIEGLANENEHLAQKLFQFATSIEIWSRQREIYGSYNYSRLALENALLLFDKIDQARGLQIHQKLIELSEIQRKYADFILLNYHTISIEHVLNAIADYHKSLLGKEDKFIVFITVFLKSIEGNNRINLETKRDFCASILKYTFSEMGTKIIAWNQLISEHIMLDLIAFLFSLEQDAVFLFDMLPDMKLSVFLQESWMPVISNINNINLIGVIELAILEYEWLKNPEYDFIGRQKKFIRAVKLNNNPIRRSDLCLEYIEKFGQTHLFEQKILNVTIENIHQIENSSAKNEYFVSFIDTILSANIVVEMEPIIEQINSIYWKCLAYQKYYLHHWRNESNIVDFLLNLSMSISNESVRNESIKEVVSRFGNFQFENLKFFAIQRITSHYWKSMALLELSKHEETYECLRLAIQEAEMIPRDSVKSEAFVEICLQFFRMGNLSSGLALIDKIPSYYWKSHVLCELIRSGKKVQPIEIIDQVKEIALKIENEEVKSESYFNLLSATIHIGLSSEYTNVFYLITAPKYKKKALRLVSETLIYKNEWIVFGRYFLNGEKRQFSQSQKDSMLRSIIKFPEIKSSLSNFKKLLHYSNQKEKILLTIEYLKQHGIRDEIYYMEIEKEILKLKINSERSECMFNLCETYLEHSIIDKLIPLASLIPSPFWRTLIYIKVYDQKMYDLDLLTNLITDSFFKIENQGFKDEIDFFYHKVLIRYSETKAKAKAQEIFDRIQSNYWKTRCLISLADFLIENNNDCKNVIQLAIETARQINQSQTGSEAMTELGLFCLNHLRLNDFEQIIGFELIKNQRDRLIAAYAQHQFSTLTDDQLLDYLKSLQTIVIRNEFIAKLIIHSLKTNRKDLFHTCLNQITSRKERIQIFSSLVLNLREDNSILIPIDFDIFIPEIMVAIVQQFNLDIIDIEQKLYYLRNMIQDEVAHFQLFHQILIKEYFLERKEAGVLVNELPNEIFDFQWAIDIKNQLPN